MKVKVGATYVYEPNGWDTVMPVSNNNLKSGQVVRVINLPGAPKANTMGQCYVADVLTGQFLCMVSTVSLSSFTRETECDILRAKIAQMEADRGTGKSI